MGLTLTQPPGAELDPGEGFEAPFCSQAVFPLGSNSNRVAKPISCMAAAGGGCGRGVCPLPRAVQKQESFVVSISSFDVNSKSSVLNL